MAFTATLFSSSTSSLSLRRSRFLDSDFSTLFSRDSLNVIFSRRFSELGITIASKKWVNLSWFSFVSCLFCWLAYTAAWCSFVTAASRLDDRKPFCIYYVHFDFYRHKYFFCFFFSWIKLGRFFLKSFLKHLYFFFSFLRYERSWGVKSQIVYDYLLRMIWAFHIFQFLQF